MAGWDKDVDRSAMEEVLNQFGKTQGYDKALTLVDLPEFRAQFPSLNVNDAEAIRSKVETNFRWQEQQSKLQAHDTNAKIEDKFSHDLLEGKLSPAEIDNAQLVNEPGGKAAGDIRKEWRSTLLSHPGREVSDRQTYNKFSTWYYNPDVPHDADAVRQKLRDLISVRDKLSETDFNSLGKDYLSLIANPNKSDASMTSENPEWKKMRTQFPSQADEIDTQENYFNKWRSMNRTAFDKEVQDKSKFFQDRVKSTSLDDAIDEMFKAKQTTGGRILGMGGHFSGEYEQAMKNVTNLYAASQAGDTKATKDVQELAGLQMLNFANKMGIGLSEFTYEMKGPYIVATVKATGKKYMDDGTGQWKELAK
jgi:hypothetical protein